ncbi:MAG: hypothetical protein GY854_14120 [Deltaproteobacteria bacterium]|nr:hypothetical protein [Deltaproteobacteria bacterium]
MSGDHQTVFLTGFPHAIVRRVAGLLIQNKSTRIRLLVSWEHRKEAEEFAQKQDGGIEIIEGAATRIDFGLSGRDYLALADEVTAIVHLDSPDPPGIHTHSPPRARIMAREVVELGLAAKQLKRIVVLSHLDVAGNATGLFAERDLDIGQGFNSHAAEDRFRCERVLRRFMDKLPITVTRAGWIVGDELGLCPLVQLLLTVDDPSSLPFKDPKSKLHAIDIETLSSILANLALLDPTNDVQTLHVAFASMPTLLDLVETAATVARDLTPVGFDFVRGARRALRRAEPGERWSAREFFKKQPYRMRLSTALSERFLKERGLVLPSLDDETMKRLTSRAVEKVVGFR